MNKVIDKGFRSCRFVSTIVKHPVHVKPGYANSFTCRTLGKIPDILTNPERVELLRSHYLTNTGAFGLTPTTDIASI